MPSAARRVGTITMHSPSAHDDAAGRELESESDAAGPSEDVALERGRIVDGDAAAALRDDAGALEHREEAAGRLARGAGELGDVGLRDLHEHVARARALGLRLLDELRQSTPATRLWTVWKDWRARRSLASRRRRPSAMTSLTAMSGCSRMQAPHVRAEDRDRLDVVERLDRRRAALVVEHRQLAEDVAGAEVGERDRAAVDVLADRRGSGRGARRSTCRWRRPRGR